MRGKTNAWLALGSVCLLWGTTYLAIRIALESFPPFVLMGVRYTISGALMVIGAKLFGATLPRGAELRRTAAYGVLTIGGGTGLLCVAEQWVPSGLSALFIAAQPFWTVILEWVLSKGELRPHGATVRGMLIGMIGVGVLVAPDAAKEGLHGGIVLGFLLLQVACIAWVTGALMQKRMESKAHAIVSGAIQQLATGFVFLALGGLFEKYPRHPSSHAIGGVLYLVFFGAIIGYSAFVYAMDRLPATIVSVYTFINPLVAVILGWLVFREPFGWRVILAMALIFSGIAVVKFSGTREAAAALEATDRLAVSD